MMADCGCYSHGGFLTAKGLEEAAQRRLELEDVVDRGESLLYLDKVGSVSAVRRDETHDDDALIDEQYRRFLNEVA